MVKATFVDDGKVVLTTLLMCLFKKESVDCKFENPKPSASIKFTVSASSIFFEINSNLFSIFKFSSLASLVASISIPVYLLIITQFDQVFFFTIMFVLIFFTHKENIKRLKNKEETKTKIY